MNTISVKPVTRPGSAELSAAFVPGNLVGLPRRGRLEWLPVPPSPSSVKGVGLPGSSRAKSRPRPYLVGARYSWGERFLFGLVAGLAVLAVQYGLSCVLDLVEHWAVFNSGIERLIN